MASLSRSYSCHYAAGACADNCNIAGLFGRCGGFGINFFKRCSGVDGALRMSALNKLVKASLLAADTGTDFVNSARARLVGPICVCKQGSAEHNHVALAVSECFLCKVGVAELADSNNGNGKTRV